MGIRKNLTNIVLAGALALGVAGCGKNDSGDQAINTIKYGGRIDNAQVTYGRTGYWNSKGADFFDTEGDDKMVVQYDNGLTLIMSDRDRDGKPDVVEAYFNKEKANSLYQDFIQKMDKE